MCAANFGNIASQVDRWITNMQEQNLHMWNMVRIVGSVLSTGRKPVHKHFCDARAGVAQHQRLKHRACIENTQLRPPILPSVPAMLCIRSEALIEIWTLARDLTLACFVTKPREAGHTMIHVESLIQVSALPEFTRVLGKFRKYVDCPNFCVFSRLLLMLTGPIAGILRGPVQVAW